MMKFHALLTVGLATAVVAPVAFGVDEIETLDTALRATSRALDVVAGVERRIEEEPELATALVKQVTEAPILDAHLRDDRLVTLRSEISLLRTELDQLELKAMQSQANPINDLDPVTEQGGAAPHGPNGPKGQAGTAGSHLQPITTGIDDTTRAALVQARTQALARVNGEDPSAATEAAPMMDSGHSPNPTGKAYSADPLREARACYRTGRFAEGAVLLTDAQGVEELFWRARCNERLGNLDLAADDLREVLATDPAGTLAQRAQQDLDFIKWKRSFLERMGNRK